MFSLFYNLKVGSVPYDQFLVAEQKRAQTFGDASEVDIVGPVARGVQAKANIDAFCEESKHWKAPTVYREVYGTFKKLTEELSSGIRAVENARDQLHRVISDSKQDGSDLKKKWHTEKQKIISHLEKTTLGCLVLCKVFGELCYYRASPPEATGVSRIWSMAPLVLTADSSRDSVFSQPVLVSKEPGKCGSPEVPKTHWHTKIDAFLNFHGQAFQERYVSHVPKTTKKREHGAIFGTFDANASKFPIHSTDPACQAWFTCGDDMPVAVCSKRISFLDVRAASNPVRGHPMWFASVNKEVALFLMTPTQHASNPDIKAWLKAVDVKELHMNPAVILLPGDAAFIPVGYIPLWCGLPSEQVDLYAARPKLSSRGKPSQGGKAEAEINTDCATVVIAPVYEKDLVPALDVDLRVQINANHVVSSSLFPKKWPDIQAVKEWLEAIAVEPPMAAASG